MKDMIIKEHKKKIKIIFKIVPHNNSDESE